MCRSSLCPSARTERRSKRNSNIHTINRESRIGQCPIPTLSVSCDRLECNCRASSHDTRRRQLLQVIQPAKEKDVTRVGFEPTPRKTRLNAHHTS
ncbi:hypothetical protein BDN71DRAFT_13341 [Pleurotus eryngii]|uniref:Uncharacterized protein n=1 Tax=Pleurotus eryngii TaxID=5323 RepID=A0A9P6A914_PLEER|nr:hypothetical protein BDN71DRAFT_13341 [Pleurotus eryngii]